MADEVRGIQLVGGREIALVPQFSLIAENDFFIGCQALLLACRAANKAEDDEGT